MNPSNTLNHKERVVIHFEQNSQNRDTKYTKTTNDFTLKMLDIMLSKQGVTSDNIFIGGSRSQLSLFISSLIEIYHYQNIDFVDMTDLYEFDSDFSC